METRLSAEGVKDVTACVATRMDMRARFMETQTRLIQQSANTLTWVMCRWRAGQDYLDKKEKEKERTAAAAADAAQTSHEGRG